MGSAFAVGAPNPAALRALNYSPELEQIRRRGGTQTRTLGDLASAIGPAYATVFARRDCDPEHGVELLSQADMFAAEPSGRVIRADSMSRPERYRIRRWQILTAGAGTLGETELYGRSIIADDRLAGKFIGQDTMTLSFEDEGGAINLFVYAFLCTGVGVRAMRSCSYGTKILRFRRDLLRALPIPVPDDITVVRVAKLVREAVENRRVYLALLAAARAVIDALPMMREATALCGLRRARAVSWVGAMPTLGAWNYASAGEAMSLLRRAWRSRIRDVVVTQGIFNGPRFARVPCERPHGVDFLSQRHVFLIRPALRRIAHPGFSDEKLFVAEHGLLVGGHGTLGEGELFGRVEYVGPQLARMALTQDVLRILPKREFSELAFAYLSTKVGFRLLRTTAVGTKILSMRPDLLHELPFPDVPADIRKNVAQLVGAAVAARTAADLAEGEAVRIIEEEVLPKWLA